MAPLPSRSRRTRLTPYLCAGLLAALYAATWSGRYVHDGATFVSRLEGGTVLHIHVGYLLAANGLHAVLRLFGPISPEASLSVLSALSGAGAFLFAALLCRSVVGAGGAALVAAGLAAISPLAWLHSCIVEIHVFSAATSSLAAYLAHRARPGPAIASTAAVSVALLGHISSLSIVPALILLAFSSPEIPRRRLSRSVLGAAAGAAAAIAGLWVLLWLGVGASWARPSSLRLLVPGEVPPLLLHPVSLALRMEQEFFPAWGLLPLFVPLALLLRPPGTGGAVVGLAAACAPGALLAALAPPYDGMYTLVLYPFLSLAAALPLSRVSGGRAGILCAALVLSHAAIAIPERIRTGADPDRAWAERIRDEVPRDALVLADGPGRARRARTIAGVEARLLGPVPASEVEPLLGIVRPAGGPEREVYVDGELVRRKEELPGLPSFLSRLSLERHAAGDLYRVTGVSPPPAR